MYRNRSATPLDSTENPVAWYGNQMARTKRPPTAAAGNRQGCRQGHRRGHCQNFGGVAISTRTLPGAVQ